MSKSVNDFLFSHYIARGQFAAGTHSSTHSIFVPCDHLLFICHHTPSEKCQFPLPTHSPACTACPCIPFSLPLLHAIRGIVTSSLQSTLSGIWSLCKPFSYILWNTATCGLLPPTNCRILRTITFCTQLDMYLVGLVGSLATGYYSGSPDPIPVHVPIKADALKAASVRLGDSETLLCTHTRHVRRRCGCDSYGNQPTVRSLGTPPSA